MTIVKLGGSVIVGCEILESVGWAVANTAEAPSVSKSVQLVRAPTDRIVDSINAAFRWRRRCLNNL